MNNKMMELGAEDSFAIYRLPNESDVILIHQKGTALELQKGDFTSEGFIIHPFHTKLQSPYFIKAQKTKINPKWSFIINKEAVPISTSTNSYLDMVNSAINDINVDMSKVVLSRVKSIQKKTGDLESIFQDMCVQYKNAFCYLVYTPDIGCWMGATPEQLILGLKKNIYSTMSLAGTRKISTTSIDTKWSEKEVEEQEIVSQYIRDQLMSLDVKYTEDRRFTLKIGPLEHICTRFRFETKNLSQLIDTFHPTPAVCGWSKDRAEEYILKNEAHDRKYYTGYLGPTFHNKLPKFFVNLRCMEIYSNFVKLYIGGGITKSSNAIKELEETELKAKMMSKLLL